MWDAEAVSDVVRYDGGTVIVQSFHVAMRFPGVGAYFQKCAFDSKCLEVRAILPGGPVEHSGCIEVGDILLEVFPWLPGED